MRAYFIHRFNRITVNPNQMGGVPCIRGMRLPVATIVNMFAHGLTFDDIKAEFNELERADIKQALAFAANALQERNIPVTI